MEAMLLLRCKLFEGKVDDDGLRVVEKCVREMVGDLDSLGELCNRLELDLELC